MPEIIVIGAGAAGLMAAGQAAERGAKVTLIEKMRQNGRKLRITGKGRCNLTNNASVRNFIARFGPNGRFLHQAFSRFFSKELINFFDEHGLPTKLERGGRLFPVSDQAPDVVKLFDQWLTGVGVKQIKDSPVRKILIENGTVAGVKIDSGLIKSSVVILTTGGKSYPGTGSSGDGYSLARQLGHTIVKPSPSLVPLETLGPIAAQLQGLSLKNVAATLYIDGKKTRSTIQGEMLFTHYGLSGPIILTLSREIVPALDKKQVVEVSIDLKPALNSEKLDARLLRDIAEAKSKQLKSIIKGLLPSKMIPVCIDLIKLDPDKPSCQMLSKERQRLVTWLKDFRFKVIGHRGFEEAVVTAGGVSLDEIDPRTMQSRIVPGLYMAGELLNFDGDTGGYNLQAAFSTGWLAGVSAGEAVTK